MLHGVGGETALSSPRPILLILSLQLSQKFRWRRCKNMSKMLDYHTRAMDFVAQATMGSPTEPVDETRAKELFRQALDWGRKAIDELEKLERHDQTYAVIHRSVAATALDCGEYQLAENLATKALESEPPKDIRGDLEDILRRAQTELAKFATLADDGAEFGVP